jgi:hypothetical protein
MKMKILWMSYQTSSKILLLFLLFIYLYGQGLFVRSEDMVDHAYHLERNLRKVQIYIYIYIYVYSHHDNY